MAEVKTVRGQEQEVMLERFRGLLLICVEFRAEE